MCTGTRCKSLSGNIAGKFYIVEYLHIVAEISRSKRSWSKRFFLRHAWNNGPPRTSIGKLQTLKFTPIFVRNVRSTIALREPTAIRVRSSFQSYSTWKSNSYWLLKPKTPSFKCLSKSWPSFIKLLQNQWLYDCHSTSKCELRKND